MWPGEKQGEGLQCLFGWNEGVVLRVTYKGEMRVEFQIKCKDNVKVMLIVRNSLVWLEWLVVLPIFPHFGKFKWKRL